MYCILLIYFMFINCNSQKLTTMKTNLFLLAIFSCIFFSCSKPVNPDQQWAMYRGNNISGVMDNANLPDSWNVESGENIAWKTEIPGLAHSCPIIWGDKVFVTTAVNTATQDDIQTGIYGSIGSVPDSSVHDWKVYCLNLHSGDVEWEKTACSGIPEQKRHPMSSHANSTPATNGKYVVAFFGSEGLYCYDMKGNLVWSKDFGVLKSNFFLVPDAEWEFSSSPLIHKDVVIIQCDVAENSFVAAFDIKTGKEIWKQDRDEFPGWETPNNYSDGEKDIVTVNGYKHRGAYDFESGEEIWRMSGGGDIPIPSPIIGNDFIYFNSAHGKVSPILAIKKDATGDITLEEEETSNEYVAWSKLRGGAYMSTMLLYGDNLYCARWNGNLSCYNALTGDQIYSEKVGDGNSYTSSPVAADGIVYVADNKGSVYSVKAGPEFELLATNQLADVYMSTPAIVKDFIVFKTAHRIIAVSKVNK